MLRARTRGYPAKRVSGPHRPHNDERPDVDGCRHADREQALPRHRVGHDSRDVTADERRPERGVGSVRVGFGAPHAVSLAARKGATFTLFVGWCV